LRAAPIMTFISAEAGIVQGISRGMARASRAPD